MLFRNESVIAGVAKLRPLDTYPILRRLSIDTNECLHCPACRWLTFYLDGLGSGGGPGCMYFTR